MKRVLVIAAALLCSGAAAAAVNDAADFQMVKRSTELRFYLAGVHAGYSVVNADRKMNGEQMLFCQPDGLMNQSLDLVAMTEGQLPVAKKSYKGGLSGLPIEFVLLDALQAAFPCSN